MKTPKVSEYMTRDPITLYVPGKRREAMKIFVRETISGILVLREDDDKLVGIVTRADVFAKPHEDQLAMIMRKDVITCKEDDSLSKAARLMVDNQVHRLPVMDGKGNLVGIISPIDMLPYVEDLDLPDTVEKVMRKGVVPLYRLMPANVALEIMGLTDAKALPVLDDEARVVGILTDRDIYAQVTVDTKIVESELGPETEEDPWTWDSLRNIMKLYYNIGKVVIPHIPIEEFMVSKPETVQTKTTVSKAARMLHRGRFNQLPVVDMSDHLNGMVIDIDLLKVIV
jgi:predicted transcriptional regulator